MTRFKCAIIILTTWSHKASNLVLLHVISYIDNVNSCCMQVFLIFWSIILKFHMNTNKSSGLPLSNKGIFNLYKFSFSDLRYLRKWIFTQYFPAFLSFLLLNDRIGGRYIWICTEPVRPTAFLMCHVLHHRILSLLHLNRQLLCKVLYILIR